MRKHKAASDLKPIKLSFRCSFTHELTWHWVCVCVCKCVGDERTTRFQKWKRGPVDLRVFNEIPAHWWTMFSVWEWDLSPPERGHLCQASSLKPASLTRTQSWHRMPKHNQSQPCSSLGSKGKEGFKSLSCQSHNHSARAGEQLRGSGYDYRGQWNCYITAEPWMFSYSCCAVVILHVNIWAVHKLERTEAPLSSRQQTNVSKQAHDVARSLSKCLGRKKQWTKRRAGTASSLFSQRRS